MLGAVCAALSWVVTVITLLYIQGTASLGALDPSPTSSARHNPNPLQIAISPQGLRSRHSQATPCRILCLLELSLHLSALTCNHPAGFTLLFYHLSKPFYPAFPDHASGHCVLEKPSEAPCSPVCNSARDWCQGALRGRVGQLQIPVTRLTLSDPQHPKL